MKIIYLIWAIISLLVCESILLYNQILGLFLYAMLIGIVLIKIDKDTSISITKSDISINKKDLISKADKLLLFLMIVPILRITEFFIDFNSFFNIFIFYSMLIVLSIFYLNRFSLDKEYNFHRKKNLFYILFGSFSLIIFFYFYLDLWEGFLIFLVPMIAYGEEILFRGGIQNLIKDYYEPLLSIILTSLIYTIFSLTYGFPIIIGIFLISALISFIHLITKSLALGIIINMIMHIILFTFF